jgi:formate dehydrogenase alpha subunit
MTVSISINGVAVKAEPGMTVLEAARANDIYVPTLCYASKLPAVGACRMCVVEIENMRGFPTACTVPVSDGMVVRTETEAVQNLRREILSLILSEHPYTCLVCEAKCGDYMGGTIRKAAVTTGCQYCPANGQCELQNLVDYLGLEEVPYPITYRGLPVEKDDPFFDRDYNLCILCGRCVRACQEIRHSGVLAFVNRGSQTIVGTAFGRSHLETDCQFCGACVDACPTGALADKRAKWEGRPSAVVPSVCPYCSVGCTVNLQVKDGKVIRAVGHDDGLTNDGQLCVRGRFGVVDVVHSLTRLKVPLVRRNGRLVEVSWDEALNVVAQHLGQYRDDQFAVVASATATNEESYALQKFARTVMHSNNVALAAGFPEDENVGELINALKASDGPAIRDVRDAACILAIGTNVFESHPILGLEMRHALSKGASLITIDARQTRMAQESDVWLQPKVGTDHVLLAGMIKVLADQGLIVGTAHHPDLAGLDLDQVTAITGVKQDSIVMAARRLAERLFSSQGNGQQGSAIIIYGSGVTHYPTAMDVIKAIHSLASLSGKVRVMGLPGEGNFVGVHDMGVNPILLPGYLSLSNPEVRRTFEAAWGVALNSNPGRSYGAILDGIRQGQIKALYLAGEMPPLPEFSNLEFLVVQDIVDTKNMEYAHVVLPATTFAEMDGTLTNMEGRVQHLRQAVQPVGLSRPGWMITRDIARSLGNALWNYQSAAEIMAEVSAVVPAYAEVSYDALHVGGTLRRFEPAPAAQPMSFRLDGIPQITNNQFPFTLITERNLFYYHGACLTEEVKGMNLIKQEEILYLSSVDAVRLGIADGALVKVVSPYGSTECIVQVTDGMVPEGAAFVSFNRVNSSPLFPTLTPSAKACAIRIEVEV